MTHKTILSCAQPTAGLHIGNYLGAIKNWVALQDDPGATCLYGVVDLHAITAGHDPQMLRQMTRETAAAYIACGVDPARSILFVQSAVPEHAQLMWLLASCAQMGKLGRMTQYKEKQGHDAEKAPLGLFAYPVLMAADILLYRATHVPVGEDQTQHLELAREVARTFNARFGDTFMEPQTVSMGPAPRVMSLRDGGVKMSKSDPSEASRIALTDDADAIARKIRKAKSDPDPLPGDAAEATGRPEAVNLLTLHAALSGQALDAVYAAFAGRPFSDLKNALTDAAVAALAPITQRMRDLMHAPEEIDALLEAGSAAARARAAPALRDAQAAMGLWSPKI